MPKIEVLETNFYKYAQKSYTHEALEALLPVAKAELDGFDKETGTLKIELNDTNRPDLWSTAGLGRQLRIYNGGDIPQYDFFSTHGDEKEAGNRRIEVDPGVKGFRPYITSLCITGKKIDEPALLDLIQTQEKLCWNFGQKRKSIAMGVHRMDLIEFPLHYRAADPDTTRFVPLQSETEMSLRQILTDHPKGREFGPIVADLEKFPYLCDHKDEAVSFPPVINSARIGGVKVGDENLFVDLTGTDIHSLMLAASIVACDLADAGFTILPVKIEYPYDTPYGRTITTPFYFQEPAGVEFSYVNRMLGEELTPEETVKALERMGCRAGVSGDPSGSAASGEGSQVIIRVPEYRNDFLHPVDLVEDVMIGRGMSTFAPLLPRDYTVGRLSPQETFSRRVKDLLIGLGFQEMMYNYLGSARDYIEKMNITSEGLIQVANPMTENYEYVRASILPALLGSEGISGNAVYPHHIFEVGKIAYLDDEDVTGTVTKNALGFLSADREMGFNQAASHVSALFYYLSLDYTLKELTDPRFIPGRGARIFYKDKSVGFFGEVHPQVLENWGIQMPCTACEIELDHLL